MSEDKITQDDNKDKLKGNDTASSSNDPSVDSDDIKADDAEISPELNCDEKINEKSVSAKKKFKINLYTVIRILCIIGFFVFTALFINEVIIQPYRIKKSIELTRDLYIRPTTAPVVTAAPTEAPVVAANAAPTPAITATPTPDPNRDEWGRLLQFKDLLAVNEDVKGWITIKDTNIDYVVTQSGSDKPDDYYLDKDLKGDYSKAGTLYLDPQSSVEAGTQNLVIHGHNMVSTKEKMFHFLLQYNETREDLDYYKKHPVINFDTIYNTGEWKIFSVFITPGNADSKDFFDYRKSTFRNSSDFLNFVYQLRIRSVINADGVDINENDELLTLSTCSYELDNYRTVIVARKVRKGEDAAVDVDSASYNTSALYPSKYYYYNGGEAPDIAATFEDALAAGQINWYTPASAAAE